MLRPNQKIMPCPAILRKENSARKVKRFNGLERTQGLSAGYKPTSNKLMLETDERISYPRRGTQMNQTRQRFEETERVPILKNAA